MAILKTFTLGCKVNQYETEYVRQGLARAGYREAADGEAPDLCVINTCAVTAEAEAKSRKTIRRLAERHPEARIVVLGCFAARSPGEALGMPGVLEIVADKRRLPEFLARHGVTDMPDGIAEFEGRRRAFVKVQDGCQSGCAYCIVPTVRPVLWSRPIGEVVAEVRRLTESGHREIVLTGIHLGMYGAEGGGLRLAKLVREITGISGDFRVRLSSLEGSDVSDELIDLMAAHPARLCPHLHIPLQSGSNEILAAMGRRWPVEMIAERCEAARRKLDRPAITTDVIVGFPGETEPHFALTCDAIEKIGFSKVHAFRFSPRPGTRAAEMDGQILDRRKQERARELGQIANGVRRRFLESLLNTPTRVLVENSPSERDDWLLGTCDRYCTFEVAACEGEIGHFKHATPTQLREIPGEENGLETDWWLC